MIAFVIRRQRTEMILCICKGDTLANALSSAGVCDDESILLGTCTDSFYRDVQEDNQTIFIEFAKFTKGAS